MKYFPLIVADTKHLPKFSVIGAITRLKGVPVVLIGEPPKIPTADYMLKPRHHELAIKADLLSPAIEAPRKPGRIQMTKKHHIKKQRVKR